MHLVERIRAVWELRGLSDSKLAELSELSRSFIWDLRKKTRDLSNTTQTALARALRIPLAVLHNDDLWATRPPRYIVAKAALDAFMAANDISPRHRSSLIDALEKGTASFLEPEGWKQLRDTLKLHDNRGPKVAEFPAAAETPARYGSRRKPSLSDQRKSKTK
jgi:transcriptional regulator with XRE-family HTH domain